MFFGRDKEDKDGPVTRSQWMATLFVILSVVVTLAIMLAVSPSATQ